MARGSGTEGNQDPVTFQRRQQKQSSFQVRDYVFCRECEQLFSKNGEDYVMRLVTKKDGTFPLLNTLNAIPTDMARTKWRAYSERQTPDLDREKIAYFASSIFWRASVHTWKMEDGEEIRLDLGKRYNEELQRYLLGETGIPRNATLMVAACVDEVSQITFFPPKENVKVKDRSVGVLIRGMFFLFRITNTPPPWQKRLSMINSPNRWISVWNCFEQNVWYLSE